jgi:MOSC domain-containing protein YiiM/GNAT superfamily N-acetyltransferase
MNGRVVQVNVSPGGVPKSPVAEARVGRLGLDGDAHDHDHVHGGPHRAVALLGLEAIERVRADGHAIAPGAVGENLTTAGIELSLLPVGTRLAIGDDVLLELASPAGPCDVIKNVFLGGKSGRISILLHPSDSRMYARVLAEGVVRTGDPIRVLPPATDSAAEVYTELDLLDHVERDAWLTLWGAAAMAGYDVRVLDRGELAAVAAPELPGSVFNRAFGMRQIPVALPEVERLYRDSGVVGWVVAGADEPPWDGAIGQEPTGVHTAPIDDVLAGAAPLPLGVTIRTVDPEDDRSVAAWVEIFIAAFALEDPLAEAWRRFGRILARSKGEHWLLAALDGRDVAAAATFTRRRVAWLGGGAVLPEARGRGIQRALIAERARLGADAGSRTITATAEVGTVSARNLEALGMRRIWTRALYRVDPARPTMPR